VEEGIEESIEKHLNDGPTFLINISLKPSVMELYLLAVLYQFPRW
jgi:hypothetical protein